jgi:hypothetical protein
MDHIAIIVLIHTAFSFILAQFVGIGIINGPAVCPTPFFPAWLTGGSFLVRIHRFMHFIQEFPGVFRGAGCIHRLPWVLDGRNRYSFFWLSLDVVVFCFLRRKKGLFLGGVGILLVRIGKDQQFTFVLHIKKGWFAGTLGLLETFGMDDGGG